MRLDVIDSQGRIETRQSSAVPQIWAVTEGRIGDDKQVLALANAIGGSVRRIDLDESLGGIFAGRLINSFGLQASWYRKLAGDALLPDLLIAAGGRCAALARWIKRASGGRTKVVIIGRPWARLADFDLIVSTPQYDLPALAVVQVNALPLNCIDVDPGDRQVAAWAERFAHLPRPWTGILIGGDSGSYQMTAECAARIASRLNDIARNTGGSLLITTSARTPAVALAILRRDLKAPHHLHEWRRGQVENPLNAILACADHLAVTGESASMIAEAVNTGRRIELLPLAERTLSRLLTTLPRRLGLNWLMQLGPVLGYWTPPRNMQRLHAALAQRGLLGACDAGAGTATDMRVVDRDLARTAARIRLLLQPDTVDDTAAILDLPAMLHGQAL
jgi:mitochondrial fission protein ELM1